LKWWAESGQFYEPDDGVNHHDNDRGYLQKFVTPVKIVDELP